MPVDDRGDVGRPARPVIDDDDLETIGGRLPRERIQAGAQGLRTVASRDDDRKV
jgi:hypothetical protein